MNRTLSRMLTISLLFGALLAGCSPSGPAAPAPSQVAVAGPAANLPASQVSATATPGATATTAPATAPGNAPTAAPGVTSTETPPTSPGATKPVTHSLRLLAPDLSAPVPVTPTLRWEGLPGVTSYRVLLIDAGTTEAVVQQDVGETELALPKPLGTGRTYHLVLAALGKDGAPATTLNAELQVAGLPDDPSTEPTLQVPAGCFREDLPVYVGQDARFCFSYPHGFTAGKNPQGTVEVMGPPAGKGPEPLFPSLTVETVPFAGQDLAPFVDEYVAPAQIVRTPLILGGHGAEMLDPVPGRTKISTKTPLAGQGLGSRVVIVDNSPQSFFILTFWPSLEDVLAGKQSAEMAQVRSDVDLLFKTVTSSLVTLPPPGVPIAPEARAVLPKTCLVDGKPTYANMHDNYCFSFTRQMAALQDPAGGVRLYGPALDRSFDPLRVEMGLTVGVAAGGKTLEQIVDVYVAGFGDLGKMVRRSALIVGGLPAVRLDGVPGRPTATEILMLRGGTLFQFRFTPDALTWKGAQNDVEALIETVTGSFVFLESDAR